MKSSIHVSIIIIPVTAAIPHDADERSVVLGGSVPGWTTVSAVVLWRRMLGALGDINKITEPEIHAQVYEYLCDLGDLMIKVSATWVVLINWVYGMGELGLEKVVLYSS